VLLTLTSVSCDPGQAGLPADIEGLQQQRQGVSERTGGLNVVRSSHTATLLQNGKVLVVGGDTTSSVTGTAELYDPATGTWTYTGSLATPRSQHCAVLLTDGRVLVTGGYTASAPGSASVVSSTELYDPATGTWSQTGALKQGRNRLACTRLPNGKVMAVGGLYYVNTSELSSYELYDPATGIWTLGSTYMTASRRSHSAILLNDGRVAVLGGTGWNGATNLATSVELFDPVTSTWSAGGSLTVARLYGAVARLDDGRILVAGGTDAPTSAELYDPSTLSSTPTGAMAQGRNYFTLTRFEPNRVLAVGGRLLNSSEVAPIEAYDVSTGTWTTLDTLRVPRAYHSATLLQGAPSRLLIAGGVNGGATSPQPAEIYKDGPDVTPPSIIQTCPEQGATLTGTRYLCANASDNVDVTRVEYYRDGDILLGTSTQGPYFYFQWDSRTAANGSHTLYGRAYDAAGNWSTSASLSVTLDNDLTPPTTTLTSPAAGAALSMAVSLTAEAADDRSVSRVEFYRDGVLLGTDFTAPYSSSWDTTLVPNGSYTLTSRAQDPSGNVTTSAGVVVTVNNEKVPPTVSLTSPTSGATLAMTVTLTAEASDNVGVTRVEFYRGSSLIGTDTTAPYSLDWNTRNAPNGSYTLTSVAHDAARNTATSSPVTVTIDNDTVAPTVTLTSPNGGYVKGEVTLSASASDNVGVTRVEFFRNNVLIGTDTTPPYSLIWDTLNFSNGAYTLTARAHDPSGNVTTSASLSVTLTNPNAAYYDSAYLRAPKCSSVESACDTVQLVDGRANLGPEPNYPNTINGSCADGTSGVYHSDPSIDRIKVYTADRTNFASGRAVTIQVSAWVRSPSLGYADVIDVYHAPNANSPVWTLVTTLSPSGSNSAQTLTTSMVLPSGTLQAVRAIVRSGGSASPCASNAYTDRDDLAFAVVSGTSDTTPPSVSIASPADGAHVSGNVTFNVDAADVGGVARVEFYQQGNLIGTDTAAPYSFSWDSIQVADGARAFEARAYDAAGNHRYSSPITVKVSNVGAAQYEPTLQAPLCSRADSLCSTGGLVNGRAHLGPERNAPNALLGSCADGATGSFAAGPSVDFLKVSTTDGAPFAPGKTVKLEASVRGSTSHRLDLYSAADATAPGWVFIGSVQPTGDGVQMLSTTYTLPTGSLQAVRGIFRSSSGAAVPCNADSQTDHDDLAFAVGAGVPDTTPPTTAITSPTSGATVSGAVTINANASDTHGVIYVEFYQGGTLLGRDASPPYSLSWNSTAISYGPVTFTTRAYDTAGNVGTSAGVSVTVNNSPPGERILNGGFEGSSSPWVLSGHSFYVASGSYPRSGTGYNELGRSNSVTGSTAQSLTLPSSGAPALSFWLNVTTTESQSSTTQWDKLFIEVLSPSGSVLQTLATFSNRDWAGAGVYSQKSYSLSAYVGQSITIRFRTTQDSSSPTTFRIDDVSVR
jgi:hypothetical protein